MKWFPRKAPENPAPGSDANGKLSACETRRQFFVDSVLALLKTLKTIPPENAGLDTAAYRQAVDELLDKLPAAVDIEKLRVLFEARHREIASFFDQLRSGIKEKENEYKDIIDILTKALAEVNSGNKTFTDKLMLQSEKMEKITLLEDIKSIKSALKREVSSMRRAVEEKKTKDSEMVEQLSKQVAALKSELDASQQVSLRDGLTGLYNENALDRYLKTLVRPAGEPQSPFSMLVIDIDHFDKIEETYGSVLGQRVILAAGQECQAAFQGGEFVARYKKGTFVVILPSESRKQAVQRAKKLALAVSAKRYQIDAALADHTLSFTVCIGVSASKKRDTAAAVTSRAIQALFSARRSGPNRVVSEKTLFVFSKNKGGTETLETLG